MWKPNDIHAQKLNDREKQILQAVVHLYILTATPVGSRSVVKRFNLEFSAATVRNVMADLEERGFLQQVHTSSGRVPTDAGYRYYVDHLMNVQQLTLAERVRIERELSRQLSDLDAVMSQTCHLLALVSEQTSIVEAPDGRQAEVRRIELIPVSADRLAVLTADNYGRLHTVITRRDEGLGDAQLARLSGFLNENVQGVTLDRLTASVQQRLHEYLDEQRKLAEQALTLLKQLPPYQSGQLFLEGASYLIEQPEFSDVAKVRQVFSLLEERERLGQLLHSGWFRGGEPPRSLVVIGSEGDSQELQDISLIAAPYRVGDKTVGMVGVLGPRRMPYPRLTALVDYTAGLLSRYMTRMAV